MKRKTAQMHFSNMVDPQLVESVNTKLTDTDN